MMPKSAITLLLLTSLVIGSKGQQASSDRVALVIGVQNYASVSPLKNSLNDAHDMAAILKTKQFQVVELYDPKSKRELIDGVRKYIGLLQGKANAVGMVYYSGHGMQVDGSNYLVPTQSDPQLKADIEDQCLNVDYLMQAIEQVGNSLNICVLDACRNNPFRSFSRSAEKGLSMVGAPKGSYIVYATKPGSVASDGTGRNGLFTSKLLKYMNEERLNIEQVFKKVAADVSIESGDLQRPWIASDYTGDFFFTPGSQTSELKSSATVPSPLKDNNAEVVKNAPVNSPVESRNSAASVRIGQLEWTSKNLDVDKFSNGDKIPEVKTMAEWKKAFEKGKPAWCYYDFDSFNGRTYGKLYNWHAVHDKRGLAPAGWHIPSSAEWTSMYRSVEEGKEYDMQLTVMQYKLPMALKGATGWDKEKAENGLNRTGFTALPGGRCDRNGKFTHVGIGGYWWSSTLKGEYPLHFELYAFNSAVNRGGDDGSWGEGFSVRCVKD